MKDYIIGIVLVIFVIVIFFASSKKYTCIDQTLDDDYLDTNEILSKTKLLQVLRDHFYDITTNDPSIKGMDYDITRRALNYNTPKEIVQYLVSMKNTKLSLNPHFIEFYKKVSELII